MAAPQVNQKDFSFIASYYNAWRVRLMHFATNIFSMYDISNQPHWSLVWPREVTCQTGGLFRGFSRDFPLGLEDLFTNPIDPSTPTTAFWDVALGRRLCTNKTLQHLVRSQQKSGKCGNKNNLIQKKNCWCSTWYFFRPPKPPKKQIQRCVSLFAGAIQTFWSGCVFWCGGVSLKNQPR